MSGAFCLLGLFSVIGYRLSVVSFQGVVGAFVRSFFSVFVLLGNPELFKKRNARNEIEILFIVGQQGVAAYD